MIRAVGVLAGGDEGVVGLLGGGADAVGPVVQDEDPLAVVVAGLVGCIDHERGVQPAVHLHSVVRVEPVRAGVGHHEVVCE